MMPDVRRVPAGESGQIIIEMILLMLVLLTLIFTFIEVCLMGIEKHEMDRIARYAARAWAVHASWSPQTAFVEAANLRKTNAPGIFYEVQPKVGSAEETTQGGRSGILVRSYIPVLMPFTEDFVGWPVDSPKDPPAGYDPKVLSNRGVRKVVRVSTFVPIDKEPAEDPSRFDNDYNDD